MHVLSVSSLKGGVGKTTVTLGLTSAAFAKGLRTLVVDLDPQSDVSTGLDIDISGHLNVADVLENPKEKIVRQAIAPSGWTKGSQGKVDVLVGSPSAINFDGPHPSIRDIWKLEEALANVEQDYELVLIDCAPSLNALTRTAWAASDRVTVVTEPGLFSVAAADRALRAIEEIRRGLSPRLQPLGIIVNRARVQSLEHQFRIKELRDMFGPLVLSPQLPERTSLQQAQGAAKPLHVWPGESAQEMAKNFDQLLERIMRTGKIGPTPRAAPPRPCRPASPVERATSVTVGGPRPSSGPHRSRSAAASDDPCPRDDDPAACPARSGRRLLDPSHVRAVARLAFRTSGPSLTEVGRGSRPSWSHDMPSARELSGRSCDHDRHVRQVVRPEPRAVLTRRSIAAPPRPAPGSRLRTPDVPSTMPHRAGETRRASDTVRVRNVVGAA